MSTTSIINSSVSGLMAYQFAISVTSNNISNVDTEGYSRQTVSIQDASQSGSDVSSLSGVQVTEAVRVSNQFTVRNVIESASSLAGAEAESEYLAYVEALFDESDVSGVNDALSEFWSAWQDLSNNPSGDSERTLLVSGASDLADELNLMVEELEDIQHEIDGEVTTSVEEVNQLTSRIAELNEKIVQYQASGQSTNSLEDSLDSLTEELAALVNIEYYENSDGQICIQLEDGHPLVLGGASWELSTETNSTTGLKDVVWDDGSGSTTVVNDSLTGGTLGGCLSVRDEYIPSYLSDLNDLASTLITEVNALLQTGYDISGTAGTAMFTGTDAGDIAVDQAFIDDPGLIAAAATADSAPGDGSIAEAVAELQYDNLMNGGTTTLDEFYSSLVTRVGLDTEEAESDYDQQSSLNEFYQNYRDSVSGVSLDEESANLIIYQQAYEACAQCITVMREMLETLMDM